MIVLISAWLTLKDIKLSVGRSGRLGRVDNISLTWRA